MTGAGAYFPYGDMRRVALEMAIDSADDFDTESVVSRAGSYFRFLIGEDSHGKIQIPPSES